MITICYLKDSYFMYICNYIPSDFIKIELYIFLFIYNVFLVTNKIIDGKLNCGDYLMPKAFITLTKKNM